MESFLIINFINEGGLASEVTLRALKASFPLFCADYFISLEVRRYILINIKPGGM